MKRIATYTLAGVLAGGLLTTTLLDRDEPQVTYAQERPAITSFATIVKPAVPAVVNISSTRVVRTGGRRGMQLPPGFEDFFGPFGGGPQQPQERRSGGTGSGVIVSRDGYILTNNHVVEDATEVTVSLTDRREFQAKVVGTDPLSDIAVLKINANNLPVLTLADSSRAQVGDIVLAIGSPLGLRSTVTMGIVSATGRGGLGIEGYEDFIQTDAPINPGNSGGALINTSGQLIGINTAILSGSGANAGIGFAVPSNMAREVMDQLIKSGKVTRGYIGVGIQEVTASLAEAFKAPVGSVVITQVEEDSPGSRAGLRVGDIILGINGENVTEANQFRLRVSRNAPGSTIRLRINRDGQPQEVPVTLATLPGQRDEDRGQGGEGESSRNALEGVEVEALTPQIARQLGITASTRGVVVSEVDPRSAAAAAGLIQGDVIQRVNNQTVGNVSEFNSAVRQAGRAQRVVLLVNRRGGSLFLAIDNAGNR